MSVFACSSPYGEGGIGQHFAQLVEEARAAGELDRYYAKRPKSDDEVGHAVSSALARWVWRYTPVRFSPSWTNYVNKEFADRKVAQHLTRPTDRFVGFVGESLRSFQQARSIGTSRLELIAANTHVNNLQRCHGRAARVTGLRDSWLNQPLRRKMLREYEMADVIHVHSEYVRQSFIAEGVPAGKLRRMHLEVDERFRPPKAFPDDGVFRIVYVGRIDATKGIPLLLRAFSELPAPEAELHLVGGWATRGMRIYLKQWTARDRRIAVAPGDPLPVLQRADVCVHPTFEDGFGYAPMEALACGIPVVVTEDTGMKEYVREGENGYIVPTGSWEALLERMEQVRRHPLRAPRSDVDPVGSA